MRDTSQLPEDKLSAISGQLSAVCLKQKTKNKQQIVNGAVVEL